MIRPAYRWFPRAAVAMGVVLLASSCSRRSATPEAAAAKPAPPTVTAVAATVQDVPEEIHAIGTVEAHQTVSLKSRVPGQLAAASFREGDEIQRGTVVLRIDPRPYEAALEQAQSILSRDQALLIKAEADMARAEELKGDGSISQATYDLRWSDVASRKATVAADQSAARAARLELDYCSIAAPITGRIGALLVDVGNVVKENDTVLATIRQVRPIDVTFSVPAQRLARIRERFAAGRLAVGVKVSDPGVPAAQGTLTLIDNTVDANTGTIQLRAEVANEDERLWPGQFAEAVLTLGTRAGVVVVPSRAVQEAQQGSYVFVVKADQTVEQRFVTLGDRYQDVVVVEQGVGTGEVVVTSGSLRLVAGMAVQVVAPQFDAARGGASGGEARS